MGHPLFGGGQAVGGERLCASDASELVPGSPGPDLGTGVVENVERRRQQCSRLPAVPLYDAGDEKRSGHFEAVLEYVATLAGLFCVVCCGVEVAAGLLEKRPWCETSRHIRPAIGSAARARSG